MLKFPLTPFRETLFPFFGKLPPNLLMKRCQCIAARDPASLNVIRGSILFMQRGEAAGGWQLRSDAAHRRARGANYVCDNMRLESECRCPIQTSSSAATTGGINRATCNNRPRIIMSVTSARARARVASISSLNNKKILLITILRRIQKFFLSLSLSLTLANLRIKDDSLG